MRRESSLLFAVACLIAAPVPLLAAPPGPVPATDFPGWPTREQSQPPWWAITVAATVADGA